MRLKNLIFFKILGYFSKLKICCGNSFGFKIFSRPLIGTKLVAEVIFLIKWINRAKFCHVIQPRKFFKAEWITTIHFELWKIAQNLEIFEPHKSPFLRCLTFEKNFVFWNSEKSVGDNPHNVYIFVTAHVRAFQNRFNHVHATFVDDSMTFQLGGLI